MAATIKDIAKALNVSVSTVSYALNGGPRSVPDEVKERVFAVARELNYRPNRLAKSMVTGRMDTIGIVPPQITEDAFLSPYLHLALNGIANQARVLQQDMLLFTRHDDTECEEMISVLVDGRVDGVIFIAPHFNHKTVELATSLHIPCVTVSGAKLDGVAGFTADSENGIHSAMNHLFELGHRKIAHVAGRLDMQDSVIRMQAYQAALRNADILYEENWVAMGQFVIDGGRKAMRQFWELDDKPTAVLCANDEMAIGVIAEAHELGIRVPDDLSVVGFDNSPSGLQIFPSLTTVRQPIGEMGAAAMRALFELIEGRTPNEKTDFQTELVVRDSTGRPKEDRNK
ncbi:MAG: LacI family DNA-binding transcriptional regulator [Fimbriimonadaceae bacterium]